MPTLELKNVSYTYEKGKAVLQSINTELETGKMYAILGPSGSGKTTLLSLLGGLDTPTQGSVLFNGEDIMAKGLEHHRRNHISLIFQSYNLIDYMTPVENVQLTAKLDGAPILERLGLEQDEITRNVLKLSGGQQQRVAIARALALKPKMLYFDEPTSALDPEITAEILQVLKKLAAEKMTMVIVTHEIDFARAVSDRILFMDEGMVVEEGTPEEVIDNPKNERTRNFLKKFQV